MLPFRDPAKGARYAPLLIPSAPRNITINLSGGFMSQGLTPEFALGYRAMMLDGIVREADCTKKVIAAIPDAKSESQPAAAFVFRIK